MNTLDDLDAEYEYQLRRYKRAEGRRRWAYIAWCVLLAVICCAIVAGFALVLHDFMSKT